MFDSGVGGLTVHHAIRVALPDSASFYCSDNEFHPYGTKADQVIANRTLDVCARFVDRCAIDILVIACNTASTVALGLLRAHLQVPVVGVVPAIKPAAAGSTSRVIGLLATPATVKRQYVDELIHQFAGDCTVVRVGSSRLVELAEEKGRGKAVNPAEVLREIEPLFAAGTQLPAGARLDAVVLGCTHFPLLLDELKAVAPWPVRWIDSGSAVAARVKALAQESSTLSRIRNEQERTASVPAAGTAFVTRLDPGAKALEPLLARFGFATLAHL
ncbi:MAG: hypothetical protein RIQ81_2276 [Pseudomonadota bacterium]